MFFYGWTTIGYRFSPTGVLYVADFGHIPLSNGPVHSIASRITHIKCHLGMISKHMSCFIVVSFKKYIADIILKICVFDFSHLA